MKKILLIVFVSLFSIVAHSQCNSYSMKFDSSTYVSINDAASLRVKNITVSIYYKTTSTAIQSLFAKNNMSDASSFQYGGSINHDYFSPIATYAVSTVHNSGCQIGQGYSSVIHQNGTVPKDVWQNFVFTYDGVTQKGYVNGNLAFSNVINKGDIDNCIGGNLLFGINYLGSACYFVGKMDEIAIYNKALTETEIQDKMNTILDPNNETGLVGLYRFEEGTGSSVADLSGNGNNGTIIGGSWSSDVPFGQKPAVPVINGPTSIPSSNLNAIYTTTNTPDLTYYWEVTNGTISGSQTDTSIAVTWDNAGPYSVRLKTINANGCSNADTLDATLITGVNSINDESVIEMYPNPSFNNELTLSSNNVKNYSIEIYNNLGVCVIKSQLLGKVVLNTESLTSGSYYIKMISNGSIITRKYTKL